ncbi:MBL fold metallo-hydrolase [Halovulum dunhuangense]|uniref:MBL fold metallo-hydrolase n=1 Tax=Halovulum dunhuangense TaxID=1505036 RepID=A0A849KW37_9RHOB|nr:MBL fold metallo-hydrolase [Halovulum dunhuangense]NNU79688.1 MBL fold metallo-hydrolase [Halovulum dunhuangense]
MDGGSQALEFPHADAPAEGAGLEIAPGILWFRLPLPNRLNHVNIYALDDGDGWSVVDTGYHSRRSVALWEAILAGPLAGRPLRRVILTHHHPDHIGMAGWLARHRDAQIWATRTAWLMARMMTLDIQDTTPQEVLAFYLRAGMDPVLLEKRKRDRPWNFADVVHPIPTGYVRLSEGDKVTTGGRDWRVVIGHGHAPGHATLWSEDGALVLAGDQVLPGISSNLGVWPTEPEADPVGDWLESCARLATLATPDQLVLPGHKLPFRGLPIRLEQLIANHHGALARLLDHLATPRTAHDCFAPLYKRSIGEGEYGLALAEAIGHLNHLYRGGQVRRDVSESGAWLWQRV